MAKLGFEIFIYQKEWKAFLALFFPIALTIFSGFIVAFIEKIFLGRYSIEAMVAAVTATNALQMFYFPVLAIPLMAQVFISQFLGADDKFSVGPCVWQMIWAAVFSALLSSSICWLVGKTYFQGMAFEGPAAHYFYLLTPLNLLYPLVATFSSFYIATGQARLLLFATLASHLVNLVLMYLLIFGYSPWIPSKGLNGAACAVLLSQGMLSLFLLVYFLSAHHRALYHTQEWTLKGSLLRTYVSPALLRLFGRILNATSLAATTWLIAHKGNDFPLVMSIGATIAVFLGFLGDALHQTVINIVSRLIGSEQLGRLAETFRRALLFFSLWGLLLAFPLLLFPEKTMHILFSQEKCQQIQEIIFPLFLGIWLLFLVFSLNSLLLGFVLAFKDLKFSLILGILNWAEFFLLYGILEIWTVKASYFWIVFALITFVSETYLLYKRVCTLSRRALLFYEDPMF